MHECLIYHPVLTGLPDPWYNGQFIETTANLSYVAKEAVRIEFECLRYDQWLMFASGHGEGFTFFILEFIFLSPFLWLCVTIICKQKYIHLKSTVSDCSECQSPAAFVALMHSQDFTQCVRCIYSPWHEGRAIQIILFLGVSIGDGIHLTALI